MEGTMMFLVLRLVCKLQLHRMRILSNERQHTIAGKNTCLTIQMLFTLTATSIIRINVFRLFFHTYI